MSLAHALDALGPVPRTVITLDFETFYSADYSLRSTTTEAYVRDERFEVLGVGVRMGETRTWLESWEFAEWAARVDWARAAVAAHHAQFDGLILAERFGVRPGFWFDTLSLARLLLGEGSLDRVARRLGIGTKGDAIESGRYKGKRRADLTQAEWHALGDYCLNDVDLTVEIARRLVWLVPRSELWLIDTTIRSFTEPVFRGNLDVLRKALADERARKAVFLDGLLQHTDTPEKAREVLASSDKFAELLRSQGVDPPQKRNAKGDLIYAFAKTDPGMKDLLEHEREEIRFLAEARLAIKSTIVETRTERLISIAQRGPVPFYLKFAGAHTHRWCMKPDVEVLTRSGWVRMDEHRGQEIACWAPSGAVSWAPAAMNSFPFSGELVRADAEYVRGAFTPEHVIPSWTTKGAFKPRRAIDARGLNIRVPVSGSLDSAGLPLSDALIRLIVATQADGSIECRETRPLRFKFRKTRKVERLRALLRDAGIAFTEFASPPETCVSVARAEVPAILWSAKLFSWDLLDLSPPQREVFLEELRFWDGAVGRNDLSYTTTVRQNAEVVVAMATLSGRTAVLHCDPRSSKNPDWADRYDVTMHRRDWVHVAAQRWGVEHYAGPVYCPTTPTGFFVVRSEGRVFVTGNSGGDKMNPQNFNRGGVLRLAIEVLFGYAIVVADSGQIEARVLPWLAGEAALLETFRRNDAKTQRYKAAFAEAKRKRLQLADDAELTKDQAKWIDRELQREGLTEGDFYSDVGSAFFLMQISKAETPTERQLAKNMILGLGFGMGWAKFGVELLRGMLGSKPVQFTLTEARRFGVDVDAFLARPWGRSGYTCGEIVAGLQTRISRAELEIHCAVADFFVRRYRATYPAIPKFWRQCENFLQLIEPDLDGDDERVRAEWRGFRFRRHSIEKPGGLRLRYPGLRKRGDQYSYLGGGGGREVQKIYGGLLTENLVQSVARDVVAEQALMIRADGLRIGTTTHDEIVAVAPAADAARALNMMIARMRTPPAWAPDLPLNAEGGHAQSYGRAK